MKHALSLLLSLCALSAAADTNVAPLGAATQSSTAFGGVAARAIDGNTDGNWQNDSVTSTNLDSSTGVGTGYAWWEVSLDQAYAVSSIAIWNRTNPCCTARLRDFTVTLLNQGVPVWSGVYSQADGPQPDVSFALNGAAGDQVRVQLNLQDYLSLAEVQVYGTPSAVPEPASLLLWGGGIAALAWRRRRPQPGR